MGAVSEQGSDGVAPGPAGPVAGVLATIAVQARRTNQVRIAQIRAVLDRASHQELDRGSWAAVERTAHQLAGSAGTFGFAGVSERARRLEQIFAVAGSVPPDDERLAVARAVLEEASAQLEENAQLD